MSDECSRGGRACRRTLSGGVCCWTGRSVGDVNQHWVDGLWGRWGVVGVGAMGWVRRGEGLGTLSLSCKRSCVGRLLIGGIQP